MEVLYILIPLALILVALLLWALLWSIRTGQFDDLEGPAHRILMDDPDEPPNDNAAKPADVDQKPADGSSHRKT